MKLALSNRLGDQRPGIGCRWLGWGNGSCCHLHNFPSNPPEPLGGSPTSGQSLSRSCQPHDQIQVELHGSLVLLSDGGGSLGGSLSEWLTLGRSDSLVDGSGGSLVDGSFESLVDGSRESLVDGENHFQIRLSIRCLNRLRMTSRTTG